MTSRRVLDLELLFDVCDLKLKLSSFSAAMFKVLDFDLEFTSAVVTSSTFLIFKTFLLI